MATLENQEPARKSVVELDVLRGLAAILMIVNHAGYRMLSADQTLTSAAAPAVFLGSVAPAVFFFATGFGIGLSRTFSKRPFDWIEVFWKATLLVVADQFLFWPNGVGMGLDFFSFTAIVTVTLSILSRHRLAPQICIALALGILMIRYLVAPALTAEPTAALLDWVLGMRAVANVSYPLSPWMVFPFLGFASGVSYRTIEHTSAKTRKRWLRYAAGFGATSCAITVVMFTLNRGFFRWGTVSIGYFMFASTVVIFVGLTAMALAIKSPAVSKAMSLRGGASFAIIPLHYSMLDAVARWLGNPLSLQIFIILTLLIVIVSFFLSTKFASLVSHILNTKQQILYFHLLFSLVVVLSIAIQLESLRNCCPVSIIAPIAQISIAALLVLGFPTSSWRNLLGNR
jgi:peptidoglycan/LPS O-acetylase OafA/YrhL